MVLTVNKSLMKLYLEGSHPLKHSLHLFCDIPCNAAWPSEILKLTVLLLQCSQSLLQAVKSIT